MNTQSKLMRSARVCTWKALVTLRMECFRAKSCGRSMNLKKMSHDNSSESQGMRTQRAGRYVTLFTVLVAVIISPNLSASTFVVNDLGDAGDANPGDGVALTAGGVTTLRAGIEESNANADADTIQFDPAVFSVVSTIPVSSELDVTQPVVIQGPGADLLTVSGQDATRIVYVNSGASLELSDITLAHGRVSGYGVGGALSFLGTQLALLRCKFLGNQCEAAAGVCYLTGSGSTVVSDCVFSGNATIGVIGPGEGGCVYIDSGSLQLRRSFFSENVARGSGSTVVVFTRVPVEIEGCSFVGNSAGSIGTMRFKTGSVVTVRDCTLSGNWAGQFAGGVAAVNTATFVDCTLVDNHTGRGAGAIAALGDVKVINCTIAGNEADSDATGGELGGGIMLSAGYSLEISNSIVAGNIDHNTTGQDVSGSFTSLGGNLIGIGDGSTGFTGTGDQVGTAASPIDPMLGPLADNGGPTQTCMPLVGSPAINAGLNALITNPPFDGPPFYDQRGPDFVRIYEDIVDIGAVERQLPPDTTPPVVTLLGEAAMPWECGVAFVDPGATALDETDGDLTPSLAVTGAVDIATPGDYVLTYSVSDASGNPAAPVTRTVTVEDTTPPVITLLGDAEMSIECHTTFTDPGATAADTCDMALPAVKADTGVLNVDAPGVYTVTYTVSDASGNPAIPVARTVTVADSLAPVITLVGEATVTMACNTDYVDAGATGADDCDTALAAVSVDTSALDTHAAGTYTVTYTLSDASGNAAAPVTRSVVVEGPCEPPRHTADQDGDHLIGLTELLRVIQFFNFDGFHCQAGTEDGYAPGPGDTSCAIHQSDYMPQDWHITLSELLRLIQFFNSGGYHACPDAIPPTEDGFCVGQG